MVVVAVVAVIAVLVPLRDSQPVDDVAEEPFVAAQFDASVGGMVGNLSAGMPELHIPPGALMTDGRVEIRQLAPFSGPMETMSLVVRQFEIVVEGQSVFADPVTLVIPYPSGRLAYDYAPAALSAAVLAEDGWVAVEGTVDQIARTVTVQTHSLSTWTLVRMISPPPLQMLQDLRQGRRDYSSCGLSAETVSEARAEEQRLSAAWHRRWNETFESYDDFEYFATGEQVRDAIGEFVVIKGVTEAAGLAARLGITKGGGAVLTVAGVKVAAVLSSAAGAVLLAIDVALLADYSSAMNEWIETDFCLSVARARLFLLENPGVEDLPPHIAQTLESGLLARITLNKWRQGLSSAEPVAPVSREPTASDRIAFAISINGDLDIYVMDMAQSVLTRLTDNSEADYQPDWSPDGQKILFVSTRNGNRDIYVMNSDGTGQVQLTDSPADDEWPDWSPDGQKIVFTSERDGDARLYIMNSDGNVLRRLTNSPGQDLYPAWSPDGRRIAFSSTRSSGLGIWVINPDGTSPRLLSPEGEIEHSPAWAPDGSKLVFHSNKGGNYPDIYVMNADGTGRAQLRGDPASDQYPTYSPDGGRIAFVRTTDGSHLYVMNADGSGLNRLTGNPEGGAWPAWAPGN